MCIFLPLDRVVDDLNPVLNFTRREVENLLHFVEEESDTGQLSISPSKIKDSVLQLACYKYPHLITKVRRKYIWLSFCKLGTKCKGKDKVRSECMVLTALTMVYTILKLGAFSLLRFYGCLPNSGNYCPVMKYPIWFSDIDYLCLKQRDQGYL